MCFIKLIADPPNAPFKLSTIDTLFDPYVPITLFYALYREKERERERLKYNYDNINKSGRENLVALTIG